MNPGDVGTFHSPRPCPLSTDLGRPFTACPSPLALALHPGNQQHRESLGTEAIRAEALVESLCELPETVAIRHSCKNKGGSGRGG